jgi:hypothetical protein
MQKKYIVRLTDAEREMLSGLLKRQRVAAQKVRLARILLKVDADGPNWTDAKIAEAFDCRKRSVESRERLVTEGLEVALHARPKSRVRRFSTASRKPRSFPSASDRRRRGLPTGRYVCLLSAPWHWRSSSRSATRPCVAR